MHQILTIIAMLASFMYTGAFSIRSARLGVRNARFGVRSHRLSMMADVSYKQGFMFPGQGAQTVGMAGALCEELPEAKELFTKVSAPGPCLAIRPMKSEYIDP
jgi:[acyl-carrier-protein] S-malonyltransferase